MKALAKISVLNSVLVLCRPVCCIGEHTGGDWVSTRDEWVHWPNYTPGVQRAGQHDPETEPGDPRPGAQWGRVSRLHRQEHWPGYGSRHR